MADRRVIQAAVFDLGGVVVDICVEATARYWAEAMQADLAEVLDPFMDDTRYQLMERGEMTMADYHAHEMRPRFTVLDLARLMGILPTAAEEIVEAWT